VTVIPGAGLERAEAVCLNSERAIGGGGVTTGSAAMVDSVPTNGAYAPVPSGDTFTGWWTGWDPSTVAETATTYVLCLQP
jgi:hypothetical protein